MVHADHLDVGEIGEGQIGANLKPFSELEGSGGVMRIW